MHQKSVFILSNISHNGDESYEGALLLENLANIYRLKGNLIRSRSYLEEACRITSEEKGEDSLEFAKMTINLGRVHTLLADYKHAMKRIKKGLKIAEGILLKLNYSSCW